MTDKVKPTPAPLPSRPPVRGHDEGEPTPAPTVKVTRPPGFDLGAASGAAAAGLEAFLAKQHRYLGFMPQPATVQTGETVGISHDPQSVRPGEATTSSPSFPLKVTGTHGAYTTLEGARRAADSYSLSHKGAEVAVVRTIEERSGRASTIYNVVSLDRPAGSLVADDNRFDNISFVEARVAEPGTGYFREGASSHSAGRRGARVERLD